MSNIDLYQNKLVEHNFFAVIGDYDTRNDSPTGNQDNASKLPFTAIASDNILRTANNLFDHVMINGVPLSVSACFFNGVNTKFQNGNGLRQNITYFYTLDIISVNDVPNQTINDEQRIVQFGNAKLFINKWNNRHYLYTVEFEVDSNPKHLINLYGITMATGIYREIIFNKTSFTIDDVDEFKEVAFNNNLVSVGRIGNKYYLLTTNETNPDIS